MAGRWHLSNCNSFDRHLFSTCPSLDCKLFEVGDDVLAIQYFMLQRGLPNRFID